MRQLMSAQKKKVDKNNNGDIYPLNVHNREKKQNIITVFSTLFVTGKKWTKITRKFGIFLIYYLLKHMRRKNKTMEINIEKSGKKRKKIRK